MRIRYLGRLDYQGTWGAMRSFTEQRNGETPDELWFLEHPPVFTLGRAGRLEHVLRPGNIPLIQVDRGGQVTYHGPGQLVAYVMLDLPRLNLGVRGLVDRLEAAVIDLLASGGIKGTRHQGAPGVFVAGEKVAALGLRVRRGFTYHGLALNVRMDLSPFERIDPCGYPGLRVTQLADLGLPWGLRETGQKLQRQLLVKLGHDSHTVDANGAL